MLWKIIEEQGYYTVGSLYQALGVEPLVEVVFHVGHCSVAPLVEPAFKFRGLFFEESCLGKSAIEKSEFSRFSSNKRFVAICVHA
jgi:hypothetical protein